MNGSSGMPGRTACFPGRSGPGQVWLQSLPFSRLASRIFAAAPQTGGGGREQGGLLSGVAAGGMLGGLLGGDSE